MPSASTIRLEIESVLGQRIPSALTPRPKVICPVTATGIETLDEVLQGGLPIGAISELVGPESSGRSSVALSFLARITQASKVCAWIDVSNSLDPASAAAVGVDLERLLWVRCGVVQNSVQVESRRFALPDKYLVPSPPKKGLHGGGFGPHPRAEANGLSEAVSGFLRPETIAPRCAEPQRRVRDKPDIFEPSQHAAHGPWLRQRLAPAIRRFTCRVPATGWAVPLRGGCCVAHPVTESKRTHVAGADWRPKSTRRNCSSP
jgi:recombination protein RecA